MKARVEIKQYVEVEIPDKRIEKLLDGYTSIVYPKGDEIDMIEHIAYNVAINGVSFVEAIGKVSVNGRYDSDIRVSYRRADIEMESSVAR